MRPQDRDTSDPSPHERPKRMPWVRPEITELPKLTNLTLQTGSPIPGGGDTRGPGSTVF
jgi:hypothetical protein